MSTRDEINEAVRAMLASVTSLNVYLVKVRDENPGEKYAVVHPIDAGPGVGGMDDAEEMRDFYFQVTCVGKSPQQVGWVSSKVESALTAKAAGGDYLHAISLTGHTVIWRLVERLGSIVPTGESLYQTPDTYKLRIGRG